MTSVDILITNAAVTVDRKNKQQGALRAHKRNPPGKDNVLKKYRNLKSKFSKTTQQS